MKLKDLIGETYKDGNKPFRPRAGDEKDFFEKHGRSLGKSLYHDPKWDDLFKGANLKMIDRSKDRHGYNPGDDEAHYEEVEVEIDEKRILVSFPSVKAKREAKKMGDVLDKKGNVRKQYHNKLALDRRKKTRPQKSLAHNLPRESVEIDEELKLKHTATAGEHTAKVYHYPEFEEYIVKYFVEGKHLKKADSHHESYDDAKKTADHQVKVHQQGHKDYAKEDVEQVDELVAPRGGVKAARVKQAERNAPPIQARRSDRSRKAYKDNLTAQRANKPFKEGCMRVRGELDKPRPKARNRIFVATNLKRSKDKKYIKK